MQLQSRYRYYATVTAAAAAAADGRSDFRRSYPKFVKLGEYF